MEGVKYTPDKMPQTIQKYANNVLLITKELTNNYHLMHQN